MRGYRLEMLLPAQTQALLDWIAQGGTLVLCPPTNARWLASDGVRMLADIRLGEPETRTSFPRLGGMPELATNPYVMQRILNGVPLDGFDPPLAVEFRRGEGRVIVMTVDLESPPFTSWVETQEFHAMLTARRAPPVRFSVEGPRVASSLPGDFNALPPFLPNVLQRVRQ